MAKKYRLTVYACKWDGRNILGIEELAGRENVVWSGDSATGLNMQVLTEGEWLTITDGWYLVRDVKGNLSLWEPEKFEAGSTYVRDGVVPVTRPRRSTRNDDLDDEWDEEEQD